METRIDKILAAINQNELFVDTDTKLQPFHIYFGLKDFYKDKLTAKDSLQMYKHHLKLETCMSMLRQRNFAGASVTLNGVEKLDRNFPYFVQNGMDSLYLAMVSYSDYILNNDYETALKKLRLAIKFGIQQSHNYPYFILSIPTQWINILRVLIRTKQEKEAIIEITELLKLTLFSIHKDSSLEPIYDALGKEEHGLVIADVFDNTIYNLERSFGHQKMREVLSAVTSNLKPEILSNKKSHNDSIVRVLSMLDDFYNDYPATFIDQLYSQIGTLIDIPSTLKKLLIDTVKAIYETKIVSEYAYTKQAVFF